MNLENVRVMLEQCRKGTEVMSTIVNLEQKLQHMILIFLWQWWLARNIANEGQKWPVYQKFVVTQSSIVGVGEAPAIAHTNCNTPGITQS